jgi:hypothetical protein
MILFKAFAAVLAGAGLWLQGASGTSSVELNQLVKFAAPRVGLGWHMDPL